MLRAGETRDPSGRHLWSSLGMTYLGAPALRNLNVTALSPIEPPAIELSPLVFAIDDACPEAGPTITAKVCCVERDRQIDPAWCERSR